MHAINLRLLLFGRLVRPLLPRWHDLDVHDQFERSVTGVVRDLDLGDERGPHGQLLLVRVESEGEPAIEQMKRRLVDGPLEFADAAVLSARKVIVSYIGEE